MEKFNNSASQQFELSKKYADRANLSVVMMCLLTLVTTFFDYQIYKPLIDQISYLDNDLANVVIAVFASAIPVAGAWVLAYLLTRLLNKRTNKRWHVPVFRAAFILVLIIIVALLTASCLLRLTGINQDDSADKLTYVWTLNILAILIAVIAFVVHLFLAITYEKNKELEELYRIEGDYLEACVEAKRYCNVTEADNQRESRDYESYCDNYDSLIEQTLNLMDLSRRVCTDMYFKNDSNELKNDLTHSPYIINGKESHSHTEAEAALSKILKTPERGSKYHPYSIDENGMLDARARKDTDNYDKRFNEIIGERSNR